MAPSLRRLRAYPGHVPVLLSLAAVLLWSGMPAPQARADTVVRIVSSVDGIQGDRQVTIAWTYGISPDDHGLVGFTACLTPAQCVDVPPTDTSATFTGLVNGTRYDPSVAVVHADGRGRFVAVDGGVVAAGAPGAPEDLDVTALPGGLVRISWSRVADNGQAPHMFVLTDTTTGERRTFWADSSSLNPPGTPGSGPWFQDVALDPGGPYEFEVSAINRTGEGPASSISFDVGPRYLLLPGDVLYPGEALTSRDYSSGRQYSLVLQWDGNVVLTHQSGRVVWHSWTFGRTGGRLAFQQDGNLVAYAQDGTALWHSDTWGHPDAALDIDDDGRVVVFDENGNILWSSRADDGPWFGADTMEATEHLTAGQSLFSPNGAFRFVLQADGNAVVYGPGGRVAWHSWTFGRPGSRLVLQGDGNLVVYTPDRRAAWHAGTWGNPGSHVVMQDDGNLVIYAADGRPLWSSTYGRVR